ncbi:retrovirus-related pol polyprotein from transposon TNT 1-94 [Tanacetum coccineum]
MVIPNKEELVSEDPSKHGRMEETEYAESQETFEAELRVLSAAKILAEASKERVKTYNRRRVSTNSSQVSTVAGLVSTAEDIQDTNEEQTKALTLFKTNTDVEMTKKKRVAEEALLQESFKKLRTTQASEAFQEQSTKETKEFSEEDLKTLLEITQENIGRLEAYQSFEDMLKVFNREDLDTLWSLVKEKFRSVKPTEDMERALWVELKRLYEPDKEDTLGHCIYMLPEKDYPLTTEVMMLMLSRRLQVEEDTKLKVVVEKYLGSTVEKAMIIVTAYFNDSQQLMKLRIASTVVGLEVIGVRLVSQLAAVWIEVLLLLACHLLCSQNITMI